MGLWLQLWSSCHVHHGHGCTVSGHSRGCCPCAACIVVVTFALCVVLLSPFSRCVGCCQCLCCIRCGVAAMVIVLHVVYAATRGAATGQPGGTWQCGAHSWEGHDKVGACPHCRCGR